MKLAQALIERKSLKEKIARLRARLLANARVREGDLPIESPAVLFRQLTAAAAEVERLEVRIDRTNVKAALPGEPGVTLAQVVARREALVLRRAALDDLLRAASGVGPPRRGGRGPQARYRSTVDVAALHEQVDAAAADVRALDVCLQAAEWAVDLET